MKLLIGDVACFHICSLRQNRMNEEQPFVDYYRILQVSPNCDSKILEAAYRHLAKIYHPDHPETADVARFKEVVEAYRMLRNPKIGRCMTYCTRKMS